MHTPAASTSAHDHAAPLDGYPLSTSQFAARNRVKPRSVFERLNRTASYHGVRPLKMASGRLYWPDVTVTADLAADLAASVEGCRHD